MSMIGNLRRLPETDLARLLQNPGSIYDYLYNEDDEGDPPAGFGAYADLDVDKAWHGIHFLLTNSPWEGEQPLAFLMCGGREVGDVDVGYGPARAFTSAEVRAIASALEAIDGAELRQRFNPGAMMEAEIYPTIWDRPPAEDDTIGYLVEHYDALREFVSDGAEDGDALLVYVN